MADTVNIATLRDSKAKIEMILERVNKNIQKFDNLDASEIDKVSNQIYTDLKYANNELEGMKIEVGNVKNEQTQKAFKDQITQLKQSIKKSNDDFTNKQNEKKNMNGLLLDDINVKIKGNNELTVQEAINKGDNILADDKERIGGMIKTVKNTNNLAIQMNQDLEMQREKLEKTDKNLKEIDYSLNRAAKQIATMLRMYATDKLIMCMIITIVLIIIAIIIVAAVGGNKSGKFNLPNDIFTSSSSNTTSSTTSSTTGARMLYLN